MSKVVGILGGMGPMATADLFKKIIENTPARSDQDHIRIIIDSNTKIPSRIQAVLMGTETPLPEMIKSAKVLEKAGAELIILPCHTAHHWLEELQKNVKPPILNLIEITARYIGKYFAGKPAGILLLASQATIRVGLYQKRFQRSKTALLVPNPQEQSIVSSAITEAKSGLIENNTFLKELDTMIAKYQKRGVSAILGGCTELSLLLPYVGVNIKKIDPTLILAQKTVSLAQ